MVLALGGCAHGLPPEGIEAAYLAARAPQAVKAPANRLCSSGDSGKTRS